METAMKVRRRILVNDESIRSIAKETGLSRNTIRKYCRGLALRLDVATLGATMIPFVNFLVIPAAVAVAGATALYIEQLKY